MNQHHNSCKMQPYASPGISSYALNLELFTGGRYLFLKLLGLRKTSLILTFISQPNINHS